MIHQVSGDILLSRAQVLAHGVAANDPMNQALALQLQERLGGVDIPIFVYSEYHARQKAREPGLG